MMVPGSGVELLPEESVQDSPPSPQSPKLVPLCRKLQTAGPPEPPLVMSQASVPEVEASLALLRESQYAPPADMTEEVTGIVT